MSKKLPVAVEPVGRPLKYDPEFHPKDFIKRAEKGDSGIEICAKWGIDMNTLLDWKKSYPEFSRAVKAGKALVNEHYINIGRRNLECSPQQFNSTLYGILTRNILNWDKKTETKVTVNSQKRPLKELTDEELEEL